MSEPESPGPYMWVEMPYNPARPKRVRGTRRVFHRSSANCVRRGEKVIGEQPPKGYFPCARCLDFGRGLAGSIRDMPWGGLWRF